MADPITLGMSALTAGLGLFGTVKGIQASQAAGQQGAVASAFTGEAQAAQAEYQAGVAKTNEEISKNETKLTEASGVVPLEETGLAGRDTIAQTTTGVAAGNVATGTGSAAKVVESEQKIAQMNEGVTQFNTNQQAYQQKINTAEQVAQAGLFKSEAATSITAGQIGAQSSLISAAGNVDQKFVQLGQSLNIPRFGGTGGSTTQTANLFPTLGGGSSDTGGGSSPANPLG